jgi:ribosomal protein S18 acetylase RimI-like enzyme
MLRIRQAGPSDLDGIVGVENSAFEEGRRASPQTFQERMRLHPQGFLVAEEDGRIAGLLTSLRMTEETDEKAKRLREFAGMPDEKAHTPDGTVFYIRSVAVRKERQGKGVGTKLIMNALALARELGCSIAVLTSTQNNERFYESLGFRRTGGYEDFHGAKQARFEMPL